VPGDFVRERSDVDIVGVSDGPLTDNEDARAFVESVLKRLEPG
jgi:hypothetical protein